MWNAVDHLLEEAIRENAFPGCAIAAGQRGKVLYTNVSGYLVRDGERQVTHSTRYDVGALTQSRLLPTHTVSRLDNTYKCIRPSFRTDISCKNESSITRHTSSAPLPYHCLIRHICDEAFRDGSVHFPHHDNSYPLHLFSRLLLYHTHIGNVLLIIYNFL